MRDTGLLFIRSIRPTLRNPLVIVFGLSQPLLYLVLFGPLLRQVAGSGSSWQWFVPGIMVQMALFGTAYAGFALIPEIRSERWNGCVSHRSAEARCYWAVYCATRCCSSSSAPCSRPR